MEKNWLIYLSIALCFFACSSKEFDIKESEVPQTVVTAFRAKYPNATIKKWEAEKENGNFYFEAEIKDEGKEKDIHITPDGLTVTEEK
jgi:hypothetical protein